MKNLIPVTSNNVFGVNFAIFFGWSVLISTMSWRMEMSKRGHAEIGINFAKCWLKVGQIRPNVG